MTGRLPLALAALALASMPASALEEPRPDITVHPSGVDDEGASARRRQEALLRRLTESEYAFRSICRICGSPERFDGPHPFEPYRALGAAAPRP